MMVREPIQSCESWIREAFKENNTDRVADRISRMLLAVDQICFRFHDSIGIRLEDFIG